MQVSGMRLTLVELLGQFQSVSMSLDQLANLLPRMGPR
jgi:sulfite reductase alpha subunit-like flavoprotein